MRHSKQQIQILTLIFIGIVLISGCKESKITQPLQPTPIVEPIKAGEKFERQELKLNALAAKMASYYEPVPLEVAPKVPSYTLPLRSSQISNYEDVSSKLNLKNSEQLLSKNGFVVINWGNEEDIVKPYNDLKKREVPIFITSDTLLHLYHIQFDETLKDIEEREFYPDIIKISKTLLDDAKEKYVKSEGIVKDAAKKNVAYFTVGLKLLEPETEIPNYVKEEVESELSLIEEHKGFKESPIFIYKEDYSQYVPRGHYTRSEILKKYFKGMMWYGRIVFLLKGADPYCDSCKAFISLEEAKTQTIAASMIADSLSQLKVDGKPVKELWERIYSVTAFYVGLADDLTPDEYLKEIKKVLGETPSIDELKNDENFVKLKFELASLRMPEIYGGTGGCYILYPPGVKIKEDDVNKCLDKSKGFRLIGQRFIPDSYMFQNLVATKVSDFKGKNPPFTACYIPDYGYVRCFPRGLDIMALLGSKEAKKILSNNEDDNFVNYDKQFKNLSNLFDSFTQEHWNKNLYWGWLYSMKALLEDYGSGYPTFMQSEAWHRKQLNAVLASWSELRHDTILYAKQSYTPGIGVTSAQPMPKPVVGYVEPVPEFYARLLALTKMTNKGLSEMDVLDEKAKNRLNSLQAILDRLLEISKKELDNKELKEDDYQFIRNFGKELESVVFGVEESGAKTTLIADVHTDINTKKVLEEGVGYVDLIVVAYKVPDGRILIGAGPVMSYYEFKHPMEDRLTDEKWRDILKTKPPEKPDWVGYSVP